MGAILEQLELNYTFFIQFAIVFVLFLFLSKVYFKPFLHLIELRHQKTVEDAKTAAQLTEKAEQKYKEYLAKLNSERQETRKIFDQMVMDAKKEEAVILQAARDEAKKITQETLESFEKQKASLKTQLQKDVEELSKSLVNKLIS